MTSENDIFTGFDEVITSLAEVWQAMDKPRPAVLSEMIGRLDAKTGPGRAVMKMMPIRFP